MKFLFDFFPLLLFFASFKLYGIFVATAVGIVASFIQSGWYRYHHGKFETMHLVTLAVITVFGGLTLLFQDETFIKWKPTIVNWCFAVAILITQFVGKKTVMERLMGRQISMPETVWRRVNLSWGLFFIVAGLLNLYVAFYYGLDLEESVRTEHWVNFKVFGLLALTLIFAVAQMVAIHKHIKDPSQTGDS